MNPRVFIGEHGFANMQQTASALPMPGFNRVCAVADARTSGSTKSRDLGTAHRLTNDRRHLDLMVRQTQLGLGQRRPRKKRDSSA